MTHRRQALIFFFATLIVSAGILVWHFRVNRGELEIQGEVPFTVTIGKFKNFLCFESPCSFRLLPKKYALRALKDEYFDLSLSVEVKRWTSSSIALRFAFKPKIETLNEAALPAKLAAIPAFVGSPFLRYDDLDLSKIPRGVTSVLFSPSGRNALIALGKERYFFQHPENFEKASLTRLELSSYAAAAFGNKENALFILESAGEKDQRIAKMEFDKSSFASLGVFEKPLERAEIFVSPNDTLLIIQEKTSLGESKFYLLDIEKKTKKRLSLQSSVNDLRFVNDEWIVYEIRENGRAVTKLFSLTSGEEKPLSSLGVKSVGRFYDKTFIFVSEEDVTGETPSVPIAEIFQMAKEGVTNFPTTPGKWFFTAMDLENSEVKSLAVLQHDEDKTFLEVADHVIEGKLFFATEKGGIKIHHQLVLEK